MRFSERLGGNQPRKMASNKTILADALKEANKKLKRKGLEATYCAFCDCYCEKLLGSNDDYCGECEEEVYEKCDDCGENYAVMTFCLKGLSVKEAVQGVELISCCEECYKSSPSEYTDCGYKVK